jgi:pyruvate dehydrogenase E2 component (dihydrolipoamide acetyltransferase)
MESGTIVRWLKSVGDPVEKGEPLYELDTEKVTQEVEADAGGVLLAVLADVGDEVEVGRTIAVIGEPGETVDEPVESPTEEAPVASAERVQQEPRDEPAAAVEPSKSPTPALSGDGRVKASPLARRIAKERGIDLAQVEGTGPDGRVVAGDVERVAAAPPLWAHPPGAPTEIDVIKLTGMRRTIARRLTEAWQAPAFQLSISADMGAVQRLREKLVERTPEGGARPTVSDVVVKAAAVALMRHRAVNALFAGDEIHVYPTANVGIAVAIPDGLVVPVIPNCERRTIAEIAEGRLGVVGRARAGALTKDDLDGGTFTVSNLGMFGIERFTAVLNPPQAAILAVGAIEERVVAEDGQAVVRPRMDLTLTCDHRAIDGATGAGFLRTLKDFLEEPGLAL